MPGLYRIYIDEVGNDKVQTRKSDVNSRFLTLTGVVMESGYVKNIAAPELEGLKRKHFPSHHPDDPVILHASELKSKCNAFECLKDPLARIAFDEDLFAYLRSLDATIISVTADKPSFAMHQEHYGKSPYTTCLLNLLERYYSFLKDRQACGDVMIESGDKSRDQKVKAMYQQIYAGTEGWTGKFSERLTSKEIKIKPKTSNIAGLQISDLVGIAIRRQVLRSYNIELDITTFSHNLYEVVEPMIRRSKGGKTTGYGIKYLE